MKEDAQREADQYRDADEIIKKAFREIEAMYPDAPLQIVLIALAHNLTALAIVSGMSKEVYMRSVKRTYELLKDGVSEEDY